MTGLQKLNHVTYMTSNIPATIEFYTEYLGMKLAAAERRKVTPADLAVPTGVSLEIGDETAASEQLTVMFEMQDGSHLSFVEVEGIKNWPANPLPRWIKHLAMKVGSVEDLKRAKALLEAKNIDYIGITDHGQFLSLYFFDPINDVRLEYTCDVGVLNEEDSRAAWEALEIWKSGGVPGNRSFK